MAKRTKMSGVDAAWLRIDESTNRMVITAVLWFDEPVDRKRLAEVIRAGWVEAYPRFRQRVVIPPRPLASPVWEDDPAFELDAHLVSVRLPAPGDQLALERLVSKLMGTPLDPARPLWQFHLVRGFGKGCAVVARIHHCIADGVTLARVLLSLVDEASGGSAAAGPAGKAGRRPRRRLIGLLRRGPELLTQLPDLARLGLKGPTTLGKLMGMAPEPGTPLKGRLGHSKRVAWSGPIPLEEVKAIGRALDATVNDVLLASVTGALRLYLEERGATARDLRATVPVNLRGLEGPVTMGNQFGLVFLPLPVGIEDRGERLRELKRQMDAIKRSPEAAVTYGLLHVLGMLPAPIERTLMNYFGRRATTVMTNVPGPRHPVHLAGARVGGIMFWVPQAGRVGLGVSIFSYAGQVTVGIASDAGLVPEPHRLIADFEEELAALGRIHGREASPAPPPRKRGRRAPRRARGQR